MSSIPEIGTLIRCAKIDERRIAFYHEIGLNCIQIAGVYEPWLSPDETARKASDNLFDWFRKYDISVPTMFFSYPNQNSSNLGLVPEQVRAERMLISCRLMEWGRRYGIKYFTCHAGFVPEERNPFYDRLVSDQHLVSSCCWGWSR